MRGTLALFLVLAGLGWPTGSAEAAEKNEKPLPAPAQRQIDFARDIKPIFQASCLRCHGDEKPKSGFRLTSRAAALKGGDNGIDILPGQSAKSPLIRYVARLDPDLVMPPEGRGAPLTAEQVGLLRAWIDQGVAWEKIAPEASTQIAATPVAGWTSVHGNESKFRELYWQREGWNGGLEDFQAVTKPDADSKITASGHVLLDDYSLMLLAERNDVGFGRFDWSQFRKYYSDTGGYDPLFSPSIFSLNRDLHLDEGRFGAEAGLTLPRWPNIVLGYEYQYRNGTEATLQWGPVSSGANTVNIYPAFRDISERVNVLKADVNYEAAGARFTDNFRGEWYQLATRDVNDAGLTLGAPGLALTTSSQQQNYFQGANTVHLEKAFKDWLFVSGGYLYSKLNGDASADVSTGNPQLLSPTAILPGWHAPEIQLERESDIFSLGGRLGPWEGFTLSTALQAEWTRESGFGTEAEDLTISAMPPFAVIPVITNDMFSSLDQTILSQDIELRYTKIPFTTVFADGRFQERKVSQAEQGVVNVDVSPFDSDIEERSDSQDFRAGFNTSPWRRVSFTAQVRHSDGRTDYNDLLKIIGPPNEGYPGFITWRDLVSNDAEAKVALQAAAWLKTSLSYEWRDDRYRAATEPVTLDLAGSPSPISPGGSLLAGSYKAHVASFNATLTPWRRLFLSASFVYQNVRTVTASNGDLAIPPYAGNIYSASVSGNYAVNDRTSLFVGYAFSRSDFFQGGFTEGLPLGINYSQHTLQAGIKRQLAKGKTLGLQYRFYDYAEPTSGGFQNFNAQAVFATLAFRWD